jgi:hypothetical protein
MIDLTAAADARNPFIVARRLASQGLAVFPVRGREPLTSHGVYSATSNLNILADMRWHNADGVGLATGKTNGIDVLDVDVRDGDDPRLLVDRESSPPLGVGRDGFAVLAQLGPLPSTLTAQIPRNGRHFYFRHVEGSRSRKLCGDGSVEWFSTGKLVVVPPAPGRQWICETEIAEAPEWLRELVLTSPRHTHAHAGRDFPGPLVTAHSSSNSSAVPKPIYLLLLRGMRSASASTQRRVRGLWANLATKASRRNDGLNFTAWQFSQFAETGDLDREIAGKLLWLACEANGYIAKDGADVVKEVIKRVLSAEPNGQKGELA